MSTTKKANPYHDEAGRFTTADNAQGNDDVWKGDLTTADLSKGGKKTPQSMPPNKFKRKSAFSFR